MDVNIPILLGLLLGLAIFIAVAVSAILILLLFSICKQKRDNSKLPYEHSCEDSIFYDKHYINSQYDLNVVKSTLFENNTQLVPFICSSKKCNKTKPVHQKNFPKNEKHLPNCTSQNTKFHTPIIVDKSDKGFKKK